MTYDPIRHWTARLKDTYINYGPVVDMIRREAMAEAYVDAAEIISKAGLGTDSLEINEAMMELTRKIKVKVVELER